MVPQGVFATLGVFGTQDVWYPRGTGCCWQAATFVCITLLHCMCVHTYACMCVCVRVCVRACVRACVMCVEVQLGV